MSQFRYQALNAHKQLVAGEIEADSVAQAIGQLEANDLVVQSIGYATGMRRAEVHEEKQPRLIVAAVDQAELDRQLKRMIERGRRLTPALSAYAAEMPHSRSQRQLMDLLQVLDMNDTSQAVAALQRLPAFWIPLLGAATTTDDAGRMVQVFVRESKRADELARLWRQTLVYPLFILCAAAAVMVLFSTIVIPIFRNVFDGFGLKLPPLTRAILVVAEVITSGWIIAIAAIVAAAAYAVAQFVQWGLPEALRNWLSDRFGKPLGRATSIAQFSQYLADLLEADFAPASALRLAGGATKSPRLQRAAWRAAGVIEVGGVNGFSNRRILTASVLHAVEADLPRRSRVTLLRELSRCHGERAMTFLSWTRGVIEPVAIVFVGLIVGVFVVGLFLPLLSLIQGLS